MTARPIRRNAQTPDRNGKIFYTSTTSLSHISKVSGHETTHGRRRCRSGRHHPHPPAERAVRLNPAGGVCRPYIRNGFISRRRSRYYYNKEAHCAEYQLHAERKCIYGISDPHYFCPEPAQEPYQSFQLRR